MAARSSEPGASVALAPSEVVLLRGEQFAGETGPESGRVQLPSGSRVNAQELATAAIAAAILASERSGGTRIETRTIYTQSWFHRKGVWFSAGEKSITWPEESYEAIFALQPGHGCSVFGLGLGKAEYTGNGWLSVVHLGFAGLVARGLLEAQEAADSADQVRWTYRMLPPLAEALAGQPVDQPKALLTDCELGRPKLWKMLVYDIGKRIEGMDKDHRRPTKRSRLGEALREAGRDLSGSDWG